MADEIDQSGVTARITLSTNDDLSVDEDAIEAALSELVDGDDVEAHTEVRRRGRPLPDDDPTDVRVEPHTPESKASFEVYEDRAGEFRWRLVHDNGNVIADSGEGYATWAGAENGLRSVKLNAPDASVERL